MSRSPEQRDGARLAPSASGLRHLRWGREILGSLRGHLALIAEGAVAASDVHGASLESALRGAHDELAEGVARLSAAVKEYRDFLERRRTEVRGRARAEVAWGVRPVESLEAFDARERTPRRSAVRTEVARLRALIEAVLTRLAPFPELQTSVLPPLADSEHVADDDDPDDDATAGSVE